MSIISGRNQTNIPLKDRLVNPELRNPGKSLHYLYQDSPPYSASVIQETIEQTPIKPVSVKQRLWQYRGGAAIVAAPGDVLPKIYGTTIVQGRVIWGSKPYLDANNRARIDIAYGLAQGVIDGVIRIYGGNDKQLLYSPDSVNGVINGVKFWKKLKFHNGALDQEKSNVIVEHETKEKTPDYHGLCYVVFRGLKLYKFNQSAPDLWFVIGRGIEEFSEDVYEEDTYPATTTDTNNLDGLGNLIYFSFNTAPLGVKTLNLDTKAVTNLAITSLKVGTDALRVFKNQVYDCTESGLKRWNGSSWDTVFHSNLERQILISPDENIMVISVWNFVKSEMYKTTDGDNYSLIPNDLPNGRMLMKVFDEDNDSMYIVLQNKNIYQGNLTSGIWGEIKTIPVGDNLYLSETSMTLFNRKLYFVLKSNPAITKLVRYNLDTSIYETFEIANTYFASDYDIEIFKDKIHVVAWNATTPDSKFVKVFDDVSETFTVLPAPSGFTANNYYKLLKYNNNLYVGTSTGIYKQGDV